MSATVFVEKEKCDHIRLNNSSGAALVQGEFAVIGGFAGVADEDIASGEVGSFHIEEGIILQASTFQTSEGTFGTVNAPVYWNNSTKKFSDTSTTGYYKVGYVTEILSGGVIRFSKRYHAELIASTVEDLAAADIVMTAGIAAIKAVAGIPFRKTVTLTAALATTPVDVLTDVQVGAGNKAYITDIDLSVNGTTAWAGTGTVVLLRDKAGSPVTAVSFAKAQLTSQAQLGKHSTGVTLGTLVRTGAGMTTAKGLEVVADGTFETGSPSDITVTVCGFIAAA